MSHFGTTDYWLEVAKGNVAGSQLRTQRGHLHELDIADGETDISEFGDLTYLTAAETMDIVSTSVNDDGSPVDTGLRTLFIEGVDGTGAYISEVITLDGTTVVVTANSYLRVNNMTGLTVGSSGWNEGEITATASTAATVQCQMDATESISQNSHFTIPLGETGFAVQFEMNASKTSAGGTPIVEFKGYIRFGGDGNAWIQLYDKKLDTSVTDEVDVFLPFPTGAIERTDIRIRALTDTNNTEVRTRLYGIFVDN